MENEEEIKNNDDFSTLSFLGFTSVIVGFVVGGILIVMLLCPFLFDTHEEDCLDTYLEYGYITNTCERYTDKLEALKK